MIRFKSPPGLFGCRKVSCERKLWAKEYEGSCGRHCDCACVFCFCRHFRPLSFATGSGMLGLPLHHSIIIFCSFFAGENINPACLPHTYRGTSTDNVRVTVEHPNGEEPYITDLTTKRENHRVEVAKGEGGSTYRVCFQSFQPKGSSTRVEVSYPAGRASFYYSCCCI